MYIRVGKPTYLFVISSSKHRRIFIAVFYSQRISLHINYSIKLNCTEWSDTCYKQRSLYWFYFSVRHLRKKCINELYSKENTVAVACTFGRIRQKRIIFMKSKRDLLCSCISNKLTITKRRLNCQFCFITTWIILTTEDFVLIFITKGT